MVWQVVVLNKIDLPHVKEMQEELEKALKAVSASQGPRECQN